MQLHLPLDFERLPEFWQLKETLQANATKPEARDELSLTMMAVYMWARLWVTLGYLARSTNQPGLLTVVGIQQFEKDLGSVFGDDCSPVLLLVQAGLLVVQDEAPARTYTCPLFRKHNEHLAGDFLPGHVKGNIRSRLSAAKNQIAHDAVQLALMLPAAVFKKRDGTTMTAREVESAMVLIMTLDRCLKARPRSKSEFTEGLIADAAAIRETVSVEDLTEFYYWIAERREHPRVPKSAEEILRDFDTLRAAAKES